MFVRRKSEEAPVCLQSVLVDSRGFWWWSVDFVHRPVFWITRERNVSETGSVSVLTWGEEGVYSVGSLGKS
jgi:hypothetical protein